MMSKAAMTSLAIGFALTVASADVEMNIVTNKGYVAFIVGDDWAVVSMQTKLPIAAAAFQIPNPAERGTSDSTNLAIVLYDAQSKKARSAFDSSVTVPGSKPPQPERYAEWTVWRQESSQGSTR
jgi:hypothetical protein